MDMKTKIKEKLLQKLNERTKPTVYARVDAYKASSSAQAAAMRSGHERGLLTTGGISLKRKLRNRP